MKFCPQCGTELGTRIEGGRERDACPADGCGFVHFGDFSIGASAVVIRDNKALMIQRGINPGKGSWQIPGGYVEHDEEFVKAVEREVLEEAGVVARFMDVVGFRHAVGGAGGTASANIYVISRLEPVSGEPQHDGVETTGAGYFSLEEMEAMERVQGLSIWAIKRALGTPLGSGFIVDVGIDGIARPGSSLLGLAGLME